MANPETIYHGPYEIRIRRVRPKGSTAEWGKAITDPIAAALIAYKLTAEIDQEVMYVIGLDQSDRVMYIQELYRGTNGSVVNRPAELFRAAIIENSRRVLIFHNHPTANPKPSLEDIETLHRVVESARILGIEISDYQIVCDDPNLFWSAQVAAGGKLMNIDLAKDFKRDYGLVDVKALNEQLKSERDAKNNL